MPDNPRNPLGRTADRLRATGYKLKATGYKLKNLDPESEDGKQIRRRVRRVAWIALVFGSALLVYSLYVLSTIAGR
ncbi:MAG: hypothetical protein WAK11_01080 [Candidatus Cybelea sp.]